jgi:Fe-S cluster biogenesis protein NfuA
MGGKMMEKVEKSTCTNCQMLFEQRFINETGHCVICHEHSKKWLNKDYEKAEKELIRIFEHYKKRNQDKKYDCIVAFSGGKDSTYALYLAKEVYGMRPLAVTGDNGLLTPWALKNMKTIVDKLGVDHLIVSHDKDELKSLYRAYFKKTQYFCEICYLTISHALGQAAIENDVPLLITGFAFKVDSSHFRLENRYCFEDAFVNIVKDSIPEEVYSKYLTKNIRAKEQFHLLHLFDYINHVESDVYRVLENELDWDSRNKNDKHSDCQFHDMVGYLRWINNDFTSLALMGPAALLRDGQITREQFDEMLAGEKERFGNVDRNQIEAFLEYFGIDESFLVKKVDAPVLAEPVLSEESFSPVIEAQNDPSISKSHLLEMLIDIIRPEVKRDGGNIDIIDFQDNLLKVKLSGACRGCMIADQVMIRYLEFLVRKYISGDIIIENTKELVS